MGELILVKGTILCGGAWPPPKWVGGGHAPARPPPSTRPWNTYKTINSLKRFPTFQPKRNVHHRACVWKFRSHTCHKQLVTHIDFQNWTSLMRCVKVCEKYAIRGKNVCVDRCVCIFFVFLFFSLAVFVTEYFCISRIELLC